MSQSGRRKWLNVGTKRIVVPESLLARLWACSFADLPEFHLGYVSDLRYDMTQCTQL